MKNIIIPILFVVFTSFSSYEKQVYICNSISSNRYHLKKSCRGLNRCKKEIKMIAISKAKGYGRTLCKWED